MAFSELIKNFDKTRDYMRDFYIYGFKARGDFDAKSARTYDNEKRRIESWLNPYIRWESDKKGKRVYISLNTADISGNPLYNAWKAKSFTDNDITLHFTILSALQEGKKDITDLTDCVCALTEQTYDAQTVRLKANEYVQEGLLLKEKRGKTDFYRLSPLTLSSLPVSDSMLIDAVGLFQEVAPFGYIGSTILDSADLKAHIFGFKHHYVVHTLEDGILFDLLRAIHEKRQVTIIQQSSRRARETKLTCVPLQIFVSVQTGRRYVCLYTERKRHFLNSRLDFIKKVELGEPCGDFESLRNDLEKAKPRSWGVSFSGSARIEELHMTLFINEETERYVLDRLEREGRSGVVTRLEQNIYQYSIELFDTNEMMAWIKTFTGRIISLEGTNQVAIKLFYNDMARLQQMYGGNA
jgi:hypothetical protein